MDSILLYGASGHGKVIADIAKNNGHILAGFIDDDVQKQTFLGLKVYHHIADFKLQNFKLIISVGNNKIRKQIVEKLNYSYATLIHASALISSSSKIGVGSVLMPNAIVNTCSKVGNHAIINTAAVVEHDCEIQNFVHISPNATIAGGVKIGEGTHIGAGAVVIPGVKIGKWVTVGAGAVIIRDIPDFCTVVGNPGKIIKTEQK